MDHHRQRNVGGITRVVYATRENCPDITEDVIEFVTNIEAKVNIAAEGWEERGE